MTKRRPQRQNPRTPEDLAIYIGCGSCAVKVLGRLQRIYSPDRITIEGCNDPTCNAPHKITIKQTTKPTIFKVTQDVIFEFIKETA